MCVIAVASYRPSLPVAFLTASLGFEEQEQLVAWLVSKKIILTPDGTKIDCKASMSALPAI